MWRSQRRRCATCAPTRRRRARGQPTSASASAPPIPPLRRQDGRRPAGRARRCAPPRRHAPDTPRPRSGAAAGPDSTGVVRRGLFRARRDQQLDGRLFVGVLWRAVPRRRRVPHRGVPREPLVPGRGVREGISCSRPARGGARVLGNRPQPMGIGARRDGGQAVPDRGGVEDVAFDRRVDVLVAFHLLSQLTEDRALAFLRRARDWTRTAMVAAMPSFESADEAARATPNGRDRAHIRCGRGRGGTQRFLEAGSRQDSLQRLGAARLQEHPLPRKMRWHLYSYAPR